MSDFESIDIKDFDHIEYATDDLDAIARVHEKFGFKKIAEREIRERKLRSYLMNQNYINVLISQSDEASDPVAQYVSKHGSGICNVAFRVGNVVSALEVVSERGAETVNQPKTVKTEFGEVETASIRAIGDVTHTFISRSGDLFTEGFETPIKEKHFGVGLKRIDHITNNVEQGQMNRWAEYYERVFGLRETRHFDISTGRTGLLSKVMESPNGVIKIPINEPTEAESQIQEYLDVHHGAGIQHLALTTTDICSSLTTIREEELEFLTVPHTYYESIPSRIPNVSESLERLEELGILVDGDEVGYLLQIFSQPVVGPFFYEVIQRKGNNGFGEGNFQALFEAMERDQVRRGVLSEAAAP